MKRSIQKLATAILFVGLISLLSGCGGTRIDQSYFIRDFDNNYCPIYLISTKVWLDNWYGSPDGLIYWETTRCSELNLDSTLVAEYRRAKHAERKAQKCLER